MTVATLKLLKAYYDYQCAYYGRKILETIRNKTGAYHPWKKSSAYFIIKILQFFIFIDKSSFENMARN